MSTSFTGRIVEVSIVPIGDTLAVDYAAGSAVVGLTTALDFDDTGTIGVTLDDGTEITGTYSAVDRDAEEITLDAPLGVDLPADTFAYPWPAGEEKVAQVSIDDDTEAVPARVPHALYDRLVEGIRDEGDEEIVTVEESAGEWTIADLLGLVPTVDGTFIAPDTLPTVDLGPLEASLATLADQLAAAQGDLSNLTDTTLPALAGDLATAQGTLTTLTGTTIPDLSSSLATAQGTLTTLTGTTIPNLSSSLATAQGTLNTHTSQIGTLNGLFPITSTSITDGAITTPKMTANSISGDRITANTLDAAKIVAGSITTDRFTANTINGDRITANTLDAAKIVAGSITTDRLTANTINGDRIAAGTLAAAKIVAGSITTSQMTANTISGDRIAAGTLDAAKIVAGSITTSQMTANSISGDRIAAGTLDAAKIVAGSITADRLSANAIDGKTITGATLRTDSPANGQRIEILKDTTTTPSLSVIRLYSGSPTEFTAAMIYPYLGSNNESSMIVSSGTNTAGYSEAATISLKSGVPNSTGTSPSSFAVNAASCAFVGYGNNSRFAYTGVASGSQVTFSSGTGYYGSDAAKLQMRNAAAAGRTLDLFTSKSDGSLGDMKINSADRFDLQAATVLALTGGTGGITASGPIAYASEARVFPTLASPFTVVSGRTPAIWRDSAGNVHMRGLVNRNAAATGATVMTLPVGYRPLSTVAVAASCAPAGAIATLNIDSTGVVQFNTLSGSPTIYAVDAVFGTLV